VTGLRLWILVLSATCFAAGLGAGVLAGEARAARRAPAVRLSAPGADYLALLDARFELSAERLELCAQLLERYAEEVEEIRQRALSQSIASVEGELARVGLRYRDAIRNHVLPADQRARFDELAARGGSPLTAQPQGD
jgi:hypothetical protein